MLLLLLASMSYFTGAMSMSPCKGARKDKRQTFPIQKHTFKYLLATRWLIKRACKISVSYKTSNNKPLSFKTSN